MTAEIHVPPVRANDAVRLLGAWLVVGVPLAWGIYATLQKAALLFR